MCRRETIKNNRKKLALPIVQGISPGNQPGDSILRKVRKFLDIELELMLRGTKSSGTVVLINLGDTRGDSAQTRK